MTDPASGKEGNQVPAQEEQEKRKNENNDNRKNENNGHDASIVGDEKEEAVLKKGTIVVIFGLQSEAGKKLNASEGLVMNEPTVNNGVLRYPVMIYANVMKDPSKANEENKWGLFLKVLETPKKNSIKGSNLKVMECQRSKLLFEKACFKYMREMEDKFELKNMLFWLEHYLRHFPENRNVGFTYGNVVREAGEGPKKALEILEYYIAHCPKDVPEYPRFCYDIALTCISTTPDNLDKALKYTLEIPSETEENRKMAMELLNRLSFEGFRIIKDLSKSDRQPAVIDVLLTTTKEILKRDPNDTGNWINVGAANCLAGHSMEGARWYRKALASGKLDTKNAKETKKNLIMAQLECPGQRLADKHVLGEKDGVVSYINKSDMDKCDIQMKAVDGSEKSFIRRLEVTGDKLKVQVYTLPDDPDDIKVFPKELLREISV